MAGVVLETVSNKKLITFGILLLCLQIAVYLIGGLVAPAPFTSHNVLATKCEDNLKTKDADKWFWSRDDGKCESIESLESIEAESKDPNNIVFTFQYPLPRDGNELDMSRWFQNIVAVLVPGIVYKKEGPHLGENNPQLTIEARLGARDKYEHVSNWTEIARSHEVRSLDCELHESVKNRLPEDKDGHEYICSPLPLFELGSCHYDHYLLNIRLPAYDAENVNTDIGKLTDFHLVSIHQNGGFTKVWFSLKAIFFPVLLVTLVWYWVRVLKQHREPNLLEKSLFALGVTISFLNLPVEFFSLWVYMPYMLLFSDIRQGLFYSVLMCFWVIFAGEHMMDQLEKNRLFLYWKQLAGVLFGCACLFVFEICERGVQLTNPFYTIWSSDTTSKLAYAFIILAGLAACVYFIYLFYMIVKVFRNISAKKVNLQSMAKARKNFYIGIIYRFNFLMFVTLLCAALTVIFFIVGQVSESQWKWDEHQSLQHTSAFLTGVYGMWNLYVLALLILYAPSHKNLQSHTTADLDESEGETVEFTTIPSETAVLPSETSSLASFARKAAAD